MEKIYSPINWKDYPDESTPIDAENLNKMDSAIEELDNRVVELSKQSDTYAKKEEIAETYATKEELAGISETVTEIATEVSKGKADVILANVSGESIHLTDSTDNNAVEFALIGKATQKQYSGKNLINNTAVSTVNNGVTYTVNEDGSVKVNGTNSTSNPANLTICEIDLKAGEQYVLSGGSKITRLVMYYISDYTKFNKFVNGTQMSVTIPVDGKYRMYASVIAGATANNELIQPMLSVEGGEYEPFVGCQPSPNPEYPQDIEVSGASGSVVVKSLGKNIFNPEWIPTQTQNGVTCTNNGDNTWTFSGSETDDSLAYGFFKRFNKETTPIQFKKAGYYRLSISGMSLDSSNQYFYMNLYYNGVVLYNALNNQQNMTMQITEEMLTYDDFRVEALGFYVTGTRTVKTGTIGVQIEYGETETEFEPYKESTTEITTEGGLAGINGVCDEIVKYADGTGKKIQRIGKAVFDGSDDEGWGMSGSVVGRMYGNVWKTNGTRNFISNMCYQVATYPDKVIGEAFIGADGNINIMTSFNNVSDWKSHLASNQMTVYYELAEPIITELSAEEIAELEVQTFYPTTNILNDSGCGMEVTYKADTKNYIDKIIGNRLSALETALINNI